MGQKTFPASAINLPPNRAKRSRCMGAEAAFAQRKQRLDGGMDSIRGTKFELSGQQRNLLNIIFAKPQFELTERELEAIWLAEQIALPRGRPKRAEGELAFSILAHGIMPASSAAFGYASYAGFASGHLAAGIIFGVASVACFVGAIGYEKVQKTPKPNELLSMEKEKHFRNFAIVSNALALAGSFCRAPDAVTPGCLQTPSRK